MMVERPRAERLTAEDITERLDLYGLRHTGPRRLLVELIQQQAGSFRAADLVEQAQRHGIGRATVFRLVDQLVQLGILSRVHGPDDCSTYTLCEPEYHHHHFVCRQCGQVIPLETAIIEQQIRLLARRIGFQIDDHHLEVFGLCGACQVGRRPLESADEGA